MVTEINADVFEKEVIESDVPVFVDFYADWCGPCKMSAPEVDKVSEVYADRMKFYKVNVDGAQKLAIKYKVMTIPLFGIFKGGELVASEIGAHRQDELEEFINKYI